MFQYFGTILYVQFRNSREGKSTSGVGNPCAPHPLNKSLDHTPYAQTIKTEGHVHLSPVRPPRHAQ